MTITKKLVISLIVTFVVLIGEIVGGILSNSLALLSDAGHVFTDIFSLGMSLLALLIMKKPADKRATYGYHRTGILAALINGVSLIFMAIFIFWEAYKRIQSPLAINTTVMLLIALAGLIGNVAIAFILGHRHDDLNVKSAWLHVLGDALASIGVIAAGLVIKFTGWQMVDPLVSGLIGLIIIIGGIGVTKEALRIFLELSPARFDIDKVSQKISLVPGVMDIHDVHLWSIGHNDPAFSAHVRLNEQSMAEVDAIRKKMEHELNHMGIKHSVLQMECAECEVNGLYCQLRTPITGETHHHSEANRAKAMALEKTNRNGVRPPGSR
jgi:cobalt-zinc-cadmium efflux system protein